MKLKTLIAKGADREEIALDLLELRGDVGVLQLRADETQPGIELVEVAIGGDPAIRLRHACAVEQRRVPRIARPGINFHRPNYFTSRWRTTPNAR